MIKMALEDLTRYQNGALAGRLLQSGEGQAYIPGALEELASDLGIDVEAAEGFIHGAMASDEGLKVAIGTYAGKYTKAESELPIKDFYEFNRDVLEAGLSDEEKAVIIEKYSNNGAKVGEMKEKIAELQYKASKKNPNKEEREKAKEELEKYQDVATMISVVDDNLYKNLLPKAIERTNQSRMKMIAKVSEEGSE